MKWLRRSAECLDEIGARYALVGGLAIGVRVEPRFTRDVDLAIAVDSDADAEAVAGHLIHSGFRLMMELDHTDTNRIATLRMLPPGIAVPSQDGDAPLLVDLLFTTSGIEPEVVAGAERRKVQEGLVVPVAKMEHLIAMKVVSVRDERPQDEVDLRQLLRRSSPQQVQAAKQLIDLVIARGLHRNRDLHATLNHFLSRSKKDR